jgi:beta-glucosidase
MTLEEKIDYIGGERDFYVRPVPRLGIPEIRMSDGPAGCRNAGPSTAYPAPIALAASFDTQLAERVGHAIGRDCRARGIHVLLAPGVNIARSPLGGRNFEYMGEDPYLAGMTAASYIRGVQSEGVLATIKHFVANDQEWDRHRVSSEVDERTLREIYFPAFERAVREGGVGGLMTAYNPLDGVYCSQNRWLLDEVLKGQWKFAGIVMSDWHAATDTLEAFNGGLDLEMPEGAAMSRAKVEPLLREHAVDVATLDDKVRRILRTAIAAGFFDRPQKRDDVPLDDPTSVSVALDAARRSIVLLKNDGALLPLDRRELKRLAVIGPNATPAVVGGSGSAFVVPFHSVSLLEGIAHAADNVEVDYHPGVRQAEDVGLLGQPCFEHGLRQEIFAGRGLAGAPRAVDHVDRIDFTPEYGSEPAPGVGGANYSIRWTGAVFVKKGGLHRVLTHADDGIRVFFDEKPVIDDWRDHGPTTNEATVEAAAGTHTVVVEYYQGTGGAVAQFGFAAVGEHRTTFLGSDEVTSIARRADVVVVSVGFGQSAATNSWHTAYAPYWPPPWARKGGLVESEDSDRPFDLPPAEVETIRLALAANPRTVVVVNAGGAVDVEPFLDRTAGLLWAWYPGQEGGRAVADVLFGDVTPSGKLPVTLAKRYADYPSAPYYNLDESHKTPYTEGIFVGYRGFEARRTAPAFPFGFGMSYTTFEYSDLRATAMPDGSAQVALRVSNRGQRDGDEIVEIYVSPSKANGGGVVARPSKQLKGFARLPLAAGETKDVSLVLEPRAFAFWDDDSKRWLVAPGTYEILAAASSGDVRLRCPVEVAMRVLPP